MCLDVKTGGNMRYVFWKWLLLIPVSLADEILGIQIPEKTSPVKTEESVVSVPVKESPAIKNKEDDDMLWRNMPIGDNADALGYTLKAGICMALLVVVAFGVGLGWVMFADHSPKQIVATAGVSNVMQVASNVALQPGPNTIFVVNKSQYVVTASDKGVNHSAKVLEKKIQPFDYPGRSGILLEIVVQDKDKVVTTKANGFRGGSWLVVVDEKGEVNWTNDPAILSRLPKRPS
jgi:hypothetical protein